MTHAEFLSDFADLSRLGRYRDGGLHRLAASEEDRQARDWLVQWLNRSGFEVSIDGIGNIYGCLKFNEDAPYILLGSHLDSQPQGGRFDGQYGVLAAAYAAREAIASGAVPKYNIAVVNWTNEEGARFQPSLTGSSVYLDDMGMDTALELVDTEGATLGEALTTIGYRGSDQPPTPIAGYLEIHVEQGRRLETQGINLAVVDECWGASKFAVEIIGEQTHTGPTPMAERKDALLAAAHVICGVNALHSILPQEDFHTSAAWIDVAPNSPNATPSTVRLKVELRSNDPELLSTAEKELSAVLDAAGDETNTEVLVRQVSRRTNLPFWGRGLELAEEAAQECGFSITRLATIAGHDAVAMAGHHPAILMFIPSANGITHNEKEHTTDDDLLNGVTAFTALLGKVLSEDLPLPDGYLHTQQLAGSDRATG